MKKIIIGAAIAAACTLSITLAYRIGFWRGVTHALDDSTYMVLDWDEHDEYDYDLHIYLDGEHYINWLFIG